MKVFHIFVMCVSKWQHKSTSKSVDATKQKPLSNCVVENILEFHKLTTMDLNDKYWENENDNSLPWYNLYI